MMRAWVLETPRPARDRPLKLRDVPVPVPGSGQVLIKVAACGICRTDLHVIEGDLEPRRSGVIPGHQIVGRVVAAGPNVPGSRVGERVGVAWLHRTCGACRFCAGGRENLCDVPSFTGWSVNGGFAEFALADADFVYPLPAGFDDLSAAPLLCAGIIGYRSLRLTGLAERHDSWSGARLGIYGFGAAGHVVIQLARAWGARVFVCTRDRERHQDLARVLGAEWVGGACDAPPQPLDSAIIFAPAGDLVPPALQALDKGGVLVLGGIHMSPIPSLEYRLLYQERVVRSVANYTREDGRAFLAEAARIGVRTTIQRIPFEQVDEGLIALKEDAIRGAGVVVMH